MVIAIYYPHLWGTQYKQKENTHYQYMLCVDTRGILNARPHDSECCLRASIILISRRFTQKEEQKWQVAFFWDCEASQCETIYRLEQSCGANRVITMRASSPSIPSPTSCSSPWSPLLFPDQEDSVSCSLPGAASMSCASALLPPWSRPFSASARALPPAHLHQHRQRGTPEPALTCEEIADPVAAAPSHRRCPPDPTSPRLQLLHGPFDLLRLQQALPDGHTQRFPPRPTSACQTGSRVHTAPTGFGQLLPTQAPSPRDGSSVPSLPALIWSTAEKKNVEDHPKRPVSLPCAHRDQGS